MLVRPYPACTSVFVSFRDMRSNWVPLIGCLVFAGMISAIGRSQVTLQSSYPNGVVPGQTTRLELIGQNFKAPLRLGATIPLSVQTVGLEPTKAIIDVAVAKDAAIGPMGIWLAGDDGISEPYQLLVDDLPSLVDNQANHQRNVPQAVIAPCAIDGKSDASLSDYYSVHLSAGAALSIDVVAERIGSSLDSFVRIYGPTGKLLSQNDDSDPSPDSQLRVVAPVEGDYVIELFDSRYAGDGRYRLRLGDFPIGVVPYPLAVRAGTPSVIQWLPRETVSQSTGNVTQAVAPSWSQTVSVPMDLIADRFSIGTSLADRPGGVWGEVLVRSMDLYPEPFEAATSAHAPQAQPLAVPVGISGRLAALNEQDSFAFSGNQGQVLRFQTRTRSLGSPAIVRLQLIGPQGQLLAESPINDSDEPGLDATLPETGTYQLRVTDLLGRGGNHFAYYVEIVPTGGFVASIKPDANTRDSKWIEVGSGATFVDFQLQRQGYDGPVQLEISNAPAGLRILNPVIPAKVNEQRVYLSADPQWEPDRMQSLTWIAKRTEDPTLAIPVQSIGLRRSKWPGQPYPPAWLEGRNFLAGGAARGPLFAFDYPAVISVPRSVKQHSFTVQVKRLNDSFKDPITVLSAAGPQGWTVQPALEKETIKVTLSRGDTATPLPPNSAISLSAYGQTTYGRIESMSVPMTEFDPLEIDVQSPSSVLAGGALQIKVRVKRSGPEVGAVTLQWGGLASSWAVPTPVIIPPDQSEAILALNVPADASISVPFAYQLVATSKFGESEFQVASATKHVVVETPPTRLETFPTSIALRRSRDAQSVVVMGFDASHGSSEWTDRASFRVADPAIAKWENGRVIPVSNGQTELIVEVASLSSKIPVSIEHADAPSRVEFENEVLVALSKQGCNSGACHGSPSGKGNFRLSLRAFDKQLDSLTLVHEETGRRLNSIEPDQSLLLLKPLLKVPHGGGVHLHKADPAYLALRDWIQQGASLDPPNQARCVKLEVFPNGQRILPTKKGQQQLVVLAHFADGTSRDVSLVAAYESSNTSVATVDQRGRVSPTVQGETVILVRFLEHIESVPFLFIDDAPGFQWQSLPQHNFIDGLVDQKLNQMRIQPSAACTDEVFLRRVYLDVIGILPAPEETTLFLNDASPDKREKLIQTLLDRPEHAKFWALKWGDLLRLTGKSVGNEGVYKYHRWIEQALRDNVPYNVFAEQLLVSAGSTFSNPPANFYRTAGDVNDCVETISQVFLGARLQCAKCHNHPFERWTQDNYYGLGAFFQRVQRKKTQRPNELFIWNAVAGEVVQPRTGQTMKPWVPVQGELTLNAADDRRKAFAEWLVRPDNPYFPRVEANRIWSQFFARGIVEPIDDFRDSNPPTNRPLLDALTKHFVESGYDRKELIRTILLSRTYQASYETNPSNDKDALYFSHQQPRLLGAEQLLDAINQLTQTEQSFGTLPIGTRATQIPAPDVAKIDFLKVFGQPERSTVCACERSEDSNLSMAIELFNGATIYDKLRNTNNRFRRGIAEGKGVDEIVRSLYLAGLSRSPTQPELAEAMKHIESRSDPIAGLEDLCWVLINTDEFLFQH